MSSPTMSVGEWGSKMNLKKPLQGDHPKYGDRRMERRSRVNKERRSGKDRRISWPGAGKSARGRKP